MIDQNHEISKLSEAMIDPLPDCPSNMSFSEEINVYNELYLRWFENSVIEIGKAA